MSLNDAHADKPRKSSSTLTLQTEERALTVLEFVASADTPPKVAGLASHLGLNVTTCYHLTNTLIQTGYLVKDDSGLFRIGPRIAFLYRGMMRDFDPARDLQGVLNDFSRRSGETAYLTSLTEFGVVVNLLAEGTHSVRVSGISIGFSGSEHIRASGRAAIAFTDEEARQRILDQATAHMKASQRKAVLKEIPLKLDEIRARGWAIDDEEYEESVCCIAAPYFFPDGAVAGSLAASIPAQRFHAHEDTLILAVRDAAATVSELLGWHGPRTGAP